MLDSDDLDPVVTRNNSELANNCESQSASLTETDTAAQTGETGQLVRVSIIRRSV